MSSKYGRNFTNFQNIGLTGSPTSAPAGVGMIEMRPGLTNDVSTISLSMIGGSTVGSENGAVEHPYFHISNAGLSVGTGFIRMTNVGSSPFGTIRLRSATYLDTDTAYQLPAKSGLLGVCGTFTVNLPAISAGNFYETLAVVSGLRVEDGFVAAMMNPSETSVTTNRGFAFLVSARPSNTGIDMMFYNPTATATVYGNHIISYTAFR